MQRDIFQKKYHKNVKTCEFKQRLGIITTVKWTFLKITHVKSNSPKQFK
jgi:hypothetical protein